MSEANLSESSCSDCIRLKQLLSDIVGKIEMAHEFLDYGTAHDLEIVDAKLDEAMKMYLQNVRGSSAQVDKDKDHGM